MSFGKRRGLRAVVSSTPLPNDRVELELVCGHKVTRHKVRNNPTAVCKTCASSDGKRADAALAKRKAAK